MKKIYKHVQYICVRIMPLFGVIFVCVFVCLFVTTFSATSKNISEFVVDDSLQQEKSLLSAGGFTASLSSAFLFFLFFWVEMINSCV